MMQSMSPRRSLASVTAFSVLVAGLILTPFAAAPALASAATDKTATATIAGLVDENRDAGAYKTSPSLTAYAKTSVEAFAKKLNAWQGPVISKFPKELVQAEGVDVPALDADYISIGFPASQKKTVAQVYEAALEYADYEGETELEGSLLLSNHFEWSGTAFTKTSKGSFLVIVLADYESSPAEFITTATPKISGTPIVGKTLTAVTKGWKAGSTALDSDDLSYSWVVAGEERGNQETFRVPADVYNKTITLKVKAAFEGYRDSAVKSSAATKKAAKGTFQVSPVVASGARNVGEFLDAAELFSWTVMPNVEPTVSFQWYRGTKKIAGETGNDYFQVPADAGKKISVVLTITGQNYTTYVKQSSTKLVTGAPLLKGVVVPTISYTDEEINYGTVLTAVRGDTWSEAFEGEPNPSIGYTYQWYIAGVPVKGATKVNWTVTAAAVNKHVTVVVTGKLAGFAPTGSASHEAFVSPLSFNAENAQVSISGSFATGKTIKATATGFEPAATSYTYRWLSGDKVVGTGNTFKVTKAVFTAGSIEVEVTAKRVGYTNALIYTNTGIG